MLPDRGSGRICTEPIRIELCGNRAAVPASIVQPLLLPDLPVFLRWRGVPPFGEQPFEELLDVVDRLIVDSTEWPGLPGPYAALADVFDRVMVSDIAWARTSRWRPQLASLWPGIAEVRRIKVTGTEAQAFLLAGWLRSRLDREIELEHEPSDRLVERRGRWRAGAVPAGRSARSRRSPQRRARSLRPRPHLRASGPRGVM